MTDKEYVISNGQAFRSASGRFFTLHRAPVSGRISIIEPSTKKEIVLVDGYPKQFEMYGKFIFDIIKNAIGERVRPCSDKQKKMAVGKWGAP